MKSEHNNGASSHYPSGNNGNGNIPGNEQMIAALFAERYGTESLAYMEEVYEQYLKNPQETSPEWREYFQSIGLPNDLPFSREVTHDKIPTIFRPTLINSQPAKSQKSLSNKEHQERLDQLIRNYRMRGHILAKIDPLGTSRGDPPELHPESFGFTEEDQDRPFSTTFLGGPDTRTLREIIQWLRLIYCGSIGVQFMHIDSQRVREWVQSKVEPTANKLKLSRDQQIRILGKLCDAFLFEEFLSKKFIGQKSFSLEGSESLIPLLDMAIQRAAEDGVKEIVFGMAHRGRLNVLANILQKSPRYIFREFLDKDSKNLMGQGDVKYHLGYSNDVVDEKGNQVHLSLCFNPSHLEFINPVALGRVRAKMEQIGDKDHASGLTILIHGDAAFAGQGMSQEVLNMSELKGYTTGGTIHVIINNQVGFTTPPEEGRSCTYATDVAKMLQIPIFHVNGEDAEAVAQVVKLSMEFRKTFKRDVVIDMYCYRRKGHNESDEPEFTQPVMYRNINKRPNTYNTYLDQLLTLRGITREEADTMLEERRKILEKELEVAQDDTQPHQSQYVQDKLNKVWRGFRGGRFIDADVVDTKVPQETLETLLNKLCSIPDGFRPHPKIHRLWEQRLEMAKGKIPLDWGTAEVLSFASLVNQKSPVRLSGQDVGRGTFSQRHAIIYDYENGQPHVSLKNLAKEVDPSLSVGIFNSPLSEAAVLGFDYGYSLDTPHGLVIWEAQFGDFCNGAQVIIDQFISSGEDKWRRLSGLVMMLPHGFEGMGPEHSSARLERFLTLAAEDNIQVVVPSTPSQHFHMLRRQVMRKWKKPLIVMTPKSLLRDKNATSSLAEIANGTFKQIMDDPMITTAEQAGKIQLVLLCSGKIYYELVRKREELKRFDTAIIRMEQLYPLPYDDLQQTLSRYKAGTPVRWVQEEPKNMGASRFVRAALNDVEFNSHPLSFVSRPESASPATGSSSSHKLEQATVLNNAFK